MEWIVPYKALFFLVLLLTYWLIFGTWEVLYTSFYVANFPVFALFHGFIKPVWKNLNLIVALLEKRFASVLLYTSNFLVNLKKYFKFRLVSTFVFLVAVILIFLKVNDGLIGICSWIILLYLISHYMLKIYTTLASTNLFSSLNEFFNGARFDFKSRKLEKDNLKEDRYSNKKIDNLVLGFFLYRLSKKFLVELVESPRLIIYYLLSFTYTFFLSIFSLAVVHYGQYIINPNNYSSELAISFNHFFYLSINAIISIEATVIKPVGVIPQYLYTVGAFIGYMIAIIYISLLFGVLIKRHNYAINKLSQTIDRETILLQSSLEKYHGISIQEAIIKVKTDDKKIAKTIEYFESIEIPQ
ncbi:MAG: hypothetical protein JXI43_05765 [Tissierellales bacterium]|nr:hypothetical protein [Tissierellales bacterium]